MIMKVLNQESIKKYIMMENLNTLKYNVSFDLSIECAFLMKVDIIKFSMYFIHFVMSVPKP